MDAFPRMLVVLALGTAAILAGCDRSFAPEANAADAVPRAQESANRPASPPPAPRPTFPPPTQAISDAAITARVNSALHTDPALAGADLSVSTDHGVVSLTGTVKSPEQVAEASARAQEPDGVMRIDTHVSVTPP